METSARGLFRGHMSVQKYYAKCNTIDIHNQGSQHDLRLEEHWVVQCGWFRLVTLLVGMIVTDSWKAYRHHLPMGSKRKKMSLVDFTSILARDCLENQYTDHDPSTIMLTIPDPAEATSSVLSVTRDGFLSPESCRRVDSFDSPKDVFGSCATHHQLFQTEEREERRENE